MAPLAPPVPTPMLISDFSQTIKSHTMNTFSKFVCRVANHRNVIENTTSWNMEYYGVWF